jgi:hypothetical protein
MFVCFVRNRLPDEGTFEIHKNYTKKPQKRSTAIIFLLVWMATYLKSWQAYMARPGQPDLRYRLITPVSKLATTCTGRIFSSTAMAGELGQGICYQGVDALAFNLGLDGQLGMKFRADAETEIAGIGFVRFFADLSACFQIVVNRLLESCSHFTDGISVKAHNVPDAQDVANQASIFGAIFNAGIAFINHGVHGFTPIISKKIRASLIWYVLASFPGCGR